LGDVLGWFSSAHDDVFHEWGEGAGVEGAADVVDVEALEGFGVPEFAFAVFGGGDEGGFPFVELEGGDLFFVGLDDLDLFAVFEGVVDAKGAVEVGGDDGLVAVAPDGFEDFGAGGEGDLKGCGWARTLYLHIGFAIKDLDHGDKFFKLICD